jgi:hypothetical protein
MIIRRQLPDKRATSNPCFPFSPESLPLITTDVRLHTKEQPCLKTLIFTGASGCSSLLTNGLSQLGRISTMVCSPLDTIRELQDGTVTIDAVFASPRNDSANISALFEFLKEEHPTVRRIAYGQHDSSSTTDMSLHSCQHDMFLWDPWDRAHFIEILKDALNCRLSRAHSSWSDLRLFESRRGADNLAISEIVKRYQYRIVRLVLDDVHSPMDAERLLKGVHSSIVRELPLFAHNCAPSEWLDRITDRTTRAYINGEIRETSLYRERNGE